MGFGLISPGGDVTIVNGGGGGGGQTLSYVNVFREVADGTAQSTADTILATVGGTSQTIGKTVYIYDGTDAILIESQGDTELPTLFAQQPEVGFTYHSHIFVDASFGLHLAQCAWECRQDEGVGAPHRVPAVGAGRAVSSGNIAADNMDKIICDLSGDLEITLSDASYGSSASNHVLVVVNALNSNVATLVATGSPVDGMTLIDGMTYLFESDGSQWIVAVAAPTSTAGSAGDIFAKTADGWQPVAGSVIASAFRNTLADNNINHQYVVNTVAATGATESLSFDHTWHDMTMDENCTFSFSSFGSNACEMFVVVRGAFTPTWPGSVLWKDATAPTYAVNPSVFRFFTVDGGSTVFGELLGGYAVD